MKTKIEKKLDAEFEKMGVVPYIYHFRERIQPFTGVTIALATRANSYKEVYELVKGVYLYERATQLKSRLERLARVGIIGIAICDIRDQYNKRIGRTIAKGRLLKALKKKNAD